MALTWPEICMEFTVGTLIFQMDSSERLMGVIIISILSNYQQDNEFMIYRGISFPWKKLLYDLRGETMKWCCLRSVL